MLTGSNFTDSTKLIFEPSTSKVTFGVRDTISSRLSFRLLASSANMMSAVVLRRLFAASGVGVNKGFEIVLR